MCPEIYPWTGVTERYQDMLDTGEEFTSLPLVSHRVGRLYISIDLPSLDIGLCRPIISRVCHFHREVKCLFPNINYRIEVYNMYIHRVVDTLLAACTSAWNMASSTPITIFTIRVTN